jgi:hypothetical protein
MIDDGTHSAGSLAAIWVEVGSGFCCACRAVSTGHNRPGGSSWTLHDS